MSKTLEDILSVTNTVFSIASPLVLPLLPGSVQTPIRVASVILQDAVGGRYTLDNAQIAKLGTAAGEAALRSARITSIREALKPLLGNGPLLEASMFEIGKRIP